MKNDGLLAACNGRIKIFALTGIRSEYDLLYPLLGVLQTDDAFDVGVIVAGAHPTPLHDYSIRHIRDDGFRIVDVIENLLFSDSCASKAKSAGLLLQGLSQTLARETPDLLVVLGDREESVTGALAGSYMSIPVVHLAGGDHTHPAGGNVDEEVRHATSKLSHIHLTMAEEHSERVKRLGEESWRVHTVGSGGIDRLRNNPGISREQLAEVVGEHVLGDYLLVIHHPVSSAIEQASDEMQRVLEQCLATGLPVFVGAPNSDPGSQSIREMINHFANYSRLHTYCNLPRDAFTAILRYARCLAGNSSLGLHEAGYFSLPTVNVGERQKGRLSGDNVQFVPAEPAAIQAALERALNDKDYRQQIDCGSSPYGDGHMTERTVQILKDLPDRQQLLAKKLTF